MIVINIISIHFVVTCAPLSLPNGFVNYTTTVENGGYLVDTVASFLCDFGYYLNDTNSRTCQASGNWNEQTPICEGYLYSLLSFFYPV